MDPYTEQLLERTRQRREMLNQKMGKTPEVTPRKRFLQDNTTDNLPQSDTKTLMKEASPGKRQCVREDEINIKPDTPAISSVRSRMHNLTQQRTDWSSGDGTDSDNSHPKPVPRKSLQNSLEEEVEPPKVEGQRRGRLANLAATINNWEDDLSHPTIPSSKNTEEKKPKWQPPKKDDSVQPPAPKSQMDSKWQTSKREMSSDIVMQSPTKKTSPGSVPAPPPPPAFHSPKKYAAPAPPTGSPIKSKTSIVLMEPHSSEVKPKHQVKHLVNKEPVNLPSRNGTNVGTTCKPVVSKVEQPVKQMATPVNNKPPCKTSSSEPSQSNANREPDSDDPASKPVSSRMASWQQRVNSSVPPKEEEPTAYSVTARMSAWETMSSSNQVSNIKKVDPGSSPSKSPCRQGPIQSNISKARTVTPSKNVKDSIMEKASKIQSSITTPVSNLQPGQSPAGKIGSATKMIHQKLFDQVQHSKTGDMADQMRKQRMAELNTLQNRWTNGVLKEDKLQDNVVEPAEVKNATAPVEKKDAIRAKAREDEQASYDFKKGQQKSGSESSGEESSRKGKAPTPPTAPPLPQQTNKALPPRPTSQPNFKANGKQSAKPGTSLYRLISQKRNDKPDVPTNKAQDHSGKKVQFEDSFDSTEDDELYAKKSSSSTEDETDIGENGDPTTDDMDTQDDSFESSNSAFSTDVDHHPVNKELPPINNQARHYMEEDTDGDDCSLSAFVPASVRRESILPHGPPQDATPQKSESHGRKTQHTVASVPSAVRHQSTTNLKKYLDETSSSQGSSTSSLNSETDSNQSSFDEDSRRMQETTDDDETNEAEIDDFLDEAMSDEESEAKQPQVTPRKRRSHMIATSGAYEAHGDEHNLVYSVSMYRNKRDGPQSPDRKIVRNRQFQADIEEEEIEMPTHLPPDVERKSVQERIHELQELVSQEQSVIMQTSNALNQCCLGNSHFAGSAEQVECNRLLLLACQKRQAYLTEMQRLKETGHLDPPGHGTKGSLTISDIRLPLKKEFVTKIGTTSDTTVHYFLILIRNNAQVITTQMLSTHDPMMRGSLDFPNLIKIHGISGSFKLTMEIFSMNVSRESIGKDKKKKTPKKSSMKSGHITMPSPGGPTAVRTTSFTLITTLPISMKSLDKTSFTLERISYLSPLHGTIYMRLKCLMEQNVEERGFLTMFEDVSGLGAWHRRWCVLAGNKLCFWKYPDDEQKKDPIGYFDLKRCITEKVGLIPRDICARPNTFELVTVRQPRRGEPDTLISKTYNTMTTTRHMLSADTKEERINWCNKINRALANIRTWHSDAMRPIRLPTKDT
ncbi:uncharacterized protein LOC143080032 isoform X3 [Mytilus galloprovincialis]|uniref:uncharacterized protein LOC143080032 isoform X3 n=1 Tax=Mytilus galloprovincialis TaxID=29158 RepID=UPI003F7BC809